MVNHGATIVTELQLVFIGAYIHCEINQAVTLERIWSMSRVYQIVFFSSSDPLSTNFADFASRIEYHPMKS